MNRLPEYPSRRSIRLPGYDYGQAGAYFVTIVTAGRRPVFGNVVDGDMVLSDVGLIAVEEWERTAIVRPDVELDAFVVMPNHMHGIIVIPDRHDGRATPRVAPTSAAPRGSGPPTESLGAIVGQFKAAVTRRATALRNLPGTPLWQRNYFEHIIRDETDLERIRAYISNNPSRWDGDVENPSHAKA